MGGWWCCKVEEVAVWFGCIMAFSQVLGMMIKESQVLPMTRIPVPQLFCAILQSMKHNKMEQKGLVRYASVAWHLN